MNTNMNIKRLPVDMLKPAKYNPRKNLKPGDPAYEKIKTSLKTHGYVDPVIWNEVTGNIVGGHQRYKVLVAEGTTEIDCVVVHIENPQDEKALNIALNKAVGEWEPVALADLLADLQLSGYNMDATGFDCAEIDDLFSQVHDKDIKDDDCQIDPEEVQPFVQPGDVWTLGRHRMVCGDSTSSADVDLLMDGLKANLVVTDPPYNVAYESADGKSIQNDSMGDNAFYEFLLAAFRNMASHMAEGGSAYIFHADTEGLNFRRAFKEAGFHISGVCIWVKNSLVLGRSPYQWQHEPVLYGSTFAEATTGVDVSGLTPENVTAMVSAYQELAAGADVSALTPNEITAYISNYLEAEGVDMSGLAPEGVTAFVLAYEEVEGGALTTALTPENITAMVGKYLEADGVDISALSPGQIEAIVTAFAEATGCDKSQLMQDFTAYIAQYDDTNAVKPTLSITVGISGYDLIAYRNFIDNNPVEVQGIVKLGEVYENPADALNDTKVTFWQNGVEVPVTAVPEEMLTADKLAVLAEDGTVHVFITPEITGSPEAISNARESLSTLYTYNDSIFGKQEISEDSPFRHLAVDTFSLIQQQASALQGMIENDNTWGDLWGLLDGLQISSLESRLAADFDPTRIGEISAYVSELVTAIQNGDQVAEEDLTQLQSIVEFLSGLQLTGTGENIRAGIAQGMTEAGWDADAETVAASLETALNTALGIQSPSTRVKPVGEYVSAGVGAGMTGYSFASDAATLAANVESAVKGSLTSTTLRSAGVNAMAGLRAGIVAGRSGVISAMRSAARAAVNAAKAELKIHSPSEVFEDEVGVMTMRGFGLGVEKEAKEQAKIIRNATRYLTGEARDGAIVTNSTDNRRTYNQNVSSTIQVQQLVVRDEQDIHSLAVEIASLTRRQQRGRGLRLA